VSDTLAYENPPAFDGLRRTRRSLYFAVTSAALWALVLVGLGYGFGLLPTLLAGRGGITEYLAMGAPITCLVPLTLMELSTIRRLVKKVAISREGVVVYGEGLPLAFVDSVVYDRGRKCITFVLRTTPLSTRRLYLQDVENLSRFLGELARLGVKLQGTELGLGTLS